eukprot:3740518-Amphidinium_carterae.1
MATIRPEVPICFSDTHALSILHADNTLLHAHSAGVRSPKRHQHLGVSCSTYAPCGVLFNALDGDDKEPLRLTFSIAHSSALERLPVSINFEVDDCVSLQHYTFWFLQNTGWFFVLMFAILVVCKA